MTGKPTPPLMKPTCHQILCTKEEGFCEHMMFDAPCMCAEVYDELEETRNKGKQNHRQKKRKRSEVCRTCGGSGVTGPPIHVCNECQGKGITNWKQDGEK